MLDVSHLTDESFHEALDRFQRPGAGQPLQLPRPGAR